MLTELKINNFAIIDEITLTFDRGLTVITGETGAGKSIIIGAVGLLLGERATAELIRSGAETAQVEALFHIGGLNQVKDLLADMGFTPSEELIIKRIISRSGRNRVFINGEMATLQMLSRLVEYLINICGQHEHQALLNAATHIDILDEYGSLLPLRARFAEIFTRYRSLLGEMERLYSLQKQRKEREELIRFQLNEIDAARPTQGEDVELLNEKRVLTHVQRLLDLSGGSYHDLYAKKGSLLEELRRVSSAVAEIVKIDPTFRISREDCDNLYYQLEDMAFALRDYSAKLSFDPERLAQIEERLETIGRLKRKYGGSIENVITKRDELEGELTAISSVEEELAACAVKVDKVKKELSELADELTRLRKEAARTLKEAIEAELSALRMAEARFEVLFHKPADEVQRDGDRYDTKGQDQIEFYLSTNLGEDLKPLNRIASGGELSRIILAIKRVLAEVGKIGTIIFDEVDSGIGGATAHTVGRKLLEVARHHQVICITHLAHIACFGDRHYRVVKRHADGRTFSAVEYLLDEGSRVQEIARMLGGADLTEKTMAHAREMVARAK